MPGNKTNSELFVEVLKTIFWPLTLVFLLCCGHNPVQRIVGALADKLEKSDSGSVNVMDKIKFSYHSVQKAQQTLLEVQAQSNNVVKEPTTDPQVPKSPEVIAAAKMVDTTINLNTQNWVYIGQVVNGKLTNCHFKIKNLPSKGDQITAIDAVYKRSSLPQELKNGDWQLGEIRGVLLDNEVATVLELHEIEDKNYWAKIK